MEKKPIRCDIEEFGEEAVQQKEELAMQRYGWYIHYVQDDNNCPNNINIHTHGIYESFDHYDFQVCMPLSMEVVQTFFHMFVKDIDKGMTFEPGVKYSDYVDGYDVEFIRAVECGRPVLRMLVPNKEGTYEGKEFADQFTMLDNN